MCFKMKQFVSRSFKSITAKALAVTIVSANPHPANSIEYSVDLSSTNESAPAFSLETLREYRLLGERVAKQAESLSQVQQALNGRSTPIEHETATCTNCSTRVQELQYTDQCTSRNSDLENRIQKLREKSPLFDALAKPQQKSSNYLKAQCVQAFMEKFPASGLYRNCQPNVGLSRASTVRPCISESYVHIVTNSFNLAATCMPHISYPVVQAAAKIFPHESGYHINAMRPGAYDAGVGQLISISIEDVNRYGLSDIRNDLMNSKSPACRAIYDEIMAKNPPLPASNAQACQRLNVENGNPLLNIIYSMSLLQIKQSRLEMMSWNQPRFKNKLQGLPAHDRKKVQEAVLMWAYNIGESVSTPLNSVLMSKYGNRQITNADEFINHMKNEIRSYMSSRSGSRNEGNSKSNYYSQVIEKFSVVDRNLGGGKCIQTP